MYNLHKKNNLSTYNTNTFTIPPDINQPYNKPRMAFPQLRNPQPIHTTKKTKQTPIITEKKINIPDSDTIKNWKMNSIDKMRQKLTDTINSRSTKIVEIVNESIPNILNELNLSCNISIEYSKYEINNNINITTKYSIMKKFMLWYNNGGVKIKSIRKRNLLSFNDYFKIADNWWNRHKGEWFGEYYFNNIFISINNYCKNIINIIYNNNYTNINTFISDYITIKCIYNISNTNVVFKQSRPQSLIYIQSITKNQTFKNQLINYGNIYNINFIKTKNLTQLNIRQSLNQYFLNILSNIKQKINDVNNGFGQEINTDNIYDIVYVPNTIPDTNTIIPSSLNENIFSPSNVNKMEQQLTKKGYGFFL